MHRIEAYFRLAAIFLFFFLIVCLPVYFLLKKKGIPLVRQVCYFGLCFPAILIVFATIFFTPISFHPNAHYLNLNPLSFLHEADTMGQIITEKIPNVLMFIPFGFFLPAAISRCRGFWKTILPAFLFSFSIEFLQYFIGRSSDIVDLLTNLLGAVLGYLIFAFLDRALRHNHFWGCVLGIDTEEAEPQKA